MLDYDDPENNDWLAVNQFTVVEDQHNRRADVVLFVNGLPLAVIELKNPADENATIWTAFNQLQTYKPQIPSLFAYNEALVISDGLQARLGSLTADTRVVHALAHHRGRGAGAARACPSWRCCCEGVFDQRRFLDLIRYFIVFEDDGDGGLVKKMAGYHQFHAVNVAVEETLRAAQHGRPRACASGGRYRPAGDPAATPATGAWAWSGTPRARARA